MTDTELKIYAELFYDSYHIPACCCDSELQIVAAFPAELPGGAFTEAAEAFWGTAQTYAFYSDRQFHHWGFLRDAASGNVLVIGPVFSVPLDDQAVHAFLREHTISGDAFDVVRSVINRITVMTLQQFLNVLQFLHYQINHERIPDDVLLGGMLPEVGQHGRYSRTRYYTNSKGIGDFAPSFDESYRIEQMLLHMIDTGNINELRQMAMDPDLPMPDIGNTPMSQQKTACIVGITVISRHVIRKGMDVNTAMRLSDLYLKAIDSAKNTKELALLMNNAYADYSERLRALKIPEATSPVIYQCIQYVQQMVNTPLSVSDVANHVQKSPSYLSARFKNEVGCTLNTFITRCKIDEAKSLLQHTEMSIADISNYLCFSDQCYFHRIFRKLTGKTPLQYRNE